MYRVVPCRGTSSRTDASARQRITIAASPPAVADIAALEPGAYELVDPSSNARRGWLYRAAPGEIVAGPTNGNCRYSLSPSVGTWRVVAWHPHLAPVVHAVEIRAHRIKRVNLVFSKKNL